MEWCKGLQSEHEQPRSRCDCRTTAWIRCVAATPLHQLARRRRTGQLVDGVPWSLTSFKTSVQSAQTDRVPGACLSLR